jgi:type I restriction enzyme M protein
MLTGELRNQIDGIWNDFWSGGLANPLQVIEQITYLIFIKRLDEMQELEERKATTLGKPIERIIFPAGKDEGGEPYANLRWSRFKHFAGPEMFRSRRACLPVHPRAQRGRHFLRAPHARRSLPNPRTGAALDCGDCASATCPCILARIGLAIP